MSKTAKASDLKLSLCKTCGKSFQLYIPYCDICREDLVWISDNGIGSRTGYWVCIKCGAEKRD